jgi:hypothetical protein
MVMDEKGRPVSGAVVFDLDKAVEARGRPAPPLRNTWVGLCGTSAGPLSAPAAPGAAPSPSQPTSGSAAATVTTAFNSGINLATTTNGARSSSVDVTAVPIKTRLVQSLHRLTRLFGVALVWDWNRPAFTGGAGEVRIPESKQLTVLSPGDLPTQPGQVYRLEQIATGERGLGSSTRLLVKPLYAPPAALERRVNWSFQETPLSDVLKTVASDAGLVVGFDKPALEEEGVTSDTPISIQVRELPLGSALEIMLGQYNLTFVWSEKSILITSQLQAGNELETRLYAVRDLLPGTGAELEQYADELQEIVEQTIAPTSWSNVGGSGSIAIFTPERAMTVRQTQWIHAEIERQLVSLRAGKNPPPSADELRIMHALDKPVSCDLENMELRAIVQHFSDQCGIPNIILDRPALEEEGVLPETRTSLRVRDRPLRLALKQLLSSWNLTMLIKDDVLQITSQLQSGNELVHRVYPIADLLQDPRNADPLIEILEQTVCVNSWSCVGGAGTIMYCTPRRLLVVNQTQAVHHEIEQLLAALRSNSPASEPPDNTVVRKALEQSLNFHFYQTRIEDALRTLADEAGVKNVIIDRPALEEEGVTPDTPVTLRGRHISAHAALRLILRSLNLGIEVHEGALLVTSQLQLGNELSVRLYAADGLLGSQSDPQILIDLIENTTARNSWSPVGGAGTLQYFAPKRYLIVCNTSAVHDEIAALLNQLRGQPRPAAPAEDRIRGALRSIYDWKFDEGTLEQFADRLSAGLDCTVVLDRVGLNEEGIKPTEPVSVVANGEPVEIAIQRGLERIGAAFMVQDEEVIITSLSGDAFEFRARAYFINSLVRSVTQGDELAEKVQEISPESWSAAGGAGFAVYFPPTGHLVVYHDEPHHIQVKQFLERVAALR